MENTQPHNRHGPEEQQLASGGGTREAVDRTLASVIRELGRELQLRESALRQLSTQTSIEEDLGLDSLTRIELLTRIEQRFNVRLSTENLAEVNTLSDLRDAILQAGALVRATPESLRESEGEPQELEEAEVTPASSQTLTEVLDWHLETHPDRPHIQLFAENGSGETLSFRELYRGALAVAGGLQADGLTRGDTVALMLPTGKDYFFSFFGVLLAGGIPVSLYPPVRISQLEDHLRRHKKILENCGATRLIAFGQVRAFSQLLKANVPSLTRVTTAEQLSRTDALPALPRLHAEDIAFLQYTSGSTGNPKGVVLTHANLLSNIRAIGEGLQASSKDVIVSWLPLYHDMGLIGCWLGSLYYSCKFVVMSPMDFIARPERWLWAIHRYRGTISAAPNFAYELCLNRVSDQQVKGLDLSSWKAACNGAEAVSPKTLRRFADRFSEYGFRQEALMPVYGLAENTVAVCFPPLGRPPRIDRIQRERFVRDGIADPATEDDGNALEFVACGSPIQGNEVRVVDDLNSELPQRHEGRLQFRSPSSTRGYYHNPAESKKLFRGDWLESGDRAYSSAGDVFITGRSKDIIIHGGRNLYPEELETAVGDLQGIRKGCVAVFGSTDPKTATEQLVLVAETRVTEDASREELRKKINLTALDLVGSPPDRIVLAPPHSVLKTSSGKIRRSATRDNYEQGKLGPQDRSVVLQVASLTSTAVLPQLRRWRQTAATAVYACWFWLIALLFAPFIWLSIMITPRLSWRWSLMRGWGWLITSLLGIRVDLRGREHLPKDDSAENNASKNNCVYAANHSGYLDVFALIAGLPRQMHFVTKVELSKHWLSRSLLDRIAVEYVTRVDRQQGAADQQRLIERAREGKSLFYFPEGTFTRVSGIYPFHMGAFVTAVKAELPVVPVAIRGSRNILHPGSRLPRRDRVEIIVDEPITVPEGAADLPKDKAWEQAIRLRDQTREALLRHTGEADLGQERPPIW
ncbi:AMP-binding protein [Proteobacteria bacterium 005FR1]|nr:AMP-binding protein [Proteobacteria bacterium 005FR1]